MPVYCIWYLICVIYYNFCGEKYCWYNLCFSILITFNCFVSWSSNKKMVDQITAVEEIDATLITTFLNDKFNEFISHVH